MLDVFFPVKGFEQFLIIVRITPDRLL